MASPSCNDDLNRERAQLERQMMAKTYGITSNNTPPTSMPKFGPPIQIQRKDDPFQKQILKVLGSFNEEAKSLIESTNHNSSISYLGLDDNPLTPASPFIIKYKPQFPDPAAESRKIQEAPNGSYGSTSQGSRPLSKINLQVSKTRLVPKETTGDSKTTNSGDVRSIQPRHSTTREAPPDLKPQSIHNSSSVPSAKSANIADVTTPPNHRIPSTSGSSSHKTHTSASAEYRKQRTPASADVPVTHRSLSPKTDPNLSPRGRTPTKQAQQRRLFPTPPSNLQKKKNDKLVLKSQDDVSRFDDSLDIEKVIKEMTHISTPITAIQTPKKEDGRFRFTSPEKGVSQLPIKGSKDSLSRSMSCTSEGTRQLNVDLHVSDSDSEDEEVSSAKAVLMKSTANDETQRGLKTETSKESTSLVNRGKTITKPISHRNNMSVKDLSESSSDSSSDGSDSDSSSSDTDDDDKVEDNKPKNEDGRNEWDLANWIQNTSNPAILPMDTSSAATAGSRIENNDISVENILRGITRTSHEVSPLDNTNGLDIHDADLERKLFSGTGTCDITSLLSPINSARTAPRRSPVQNKKHSSASSCDSDSDSDSEDDEKSSRKLHDPTFSPNGANKVPRSNHVTNTAKLTPNAVGSGKTRKAPTKPVASKSPRQRSSGKSSSSGSTTKGKDISNDSGYKGKRTPKVTEPSVNHTKPNSAKKVAAKKPTPSAKPASSKSAPSVTPRGRPKSNALSKSPKSKELISSGESSSSSSSSSSSDSSSSSSDSEPEQSVSQSTSARSQTAVTVEMAPPVSRSLKVSKSQPSLTPAPSKPLEDSLHNQSLNTSTASASNTSLDLDEELIKPPPGLLSPINPDKHCPTPDLLERSKASSPNPAIPSSDDNLPKPAMNYTSDGKPSIIVKLDIALIRHMLHPRHVAQYSSKTKNIPTQNALPAKSSAISIQTKNSKLDTSKKNKLVPSKDLKLDGSREVIPNCVDSVTDKEEIRTKKDESRNSQANLSSVVPSPSEEKSRTGLSVSGKDNLDRSSATKVEGAKSQESQVAKVKRKDGQEERAVIKSICGMDDKPSVATLTIPKRKHHDSRSNDHKRHRTNPSSRDSSLSRNSVRDSSERDSYAVNQEAPWSSSRSVEDDRLSTTSSTSSHRGDRDRERERVHRPNKRKASEDRDHDRDSNRYRDYDNERERDRGRDRNKMPRHDLPVPNGALDTSRHCEAAATPPLGSVQKAAQIWGDMLLNPDYSKHGHHSRDDEPLDRRKPKPPIEPVIERLKPAHYYLQEAKTLKHEAEGTAQTRISKLLKYLEAVLSFVQCGCSMEKDASDQNQKGVFKMYKDTLKFSRDILKGSSRHDHVESAECKLTVLSFRLQSLLCLKLFQLKKTEASKLKRVMDEYYRSAAAAKPTQAPSPYQTNPGSAQRPGNTGTPSPMSQQASPEGSVNSVGSCSDNVPRLLNNGTSVANPSASMVATTPANSNVAIPTRIHSVSLSYLTLMDYLYQCHDIWDQADLLADKYKDYFPDLDRDCKPLSLHSTIPEMVRYIKEGIHRLRRSLPPSLSGPS